MALPSGIGALIASCPILPVLILMIAFDQPAMRSYAYRMGSINYTGFCHMSNGRHVVFGVNR